MDKVRSFDFKRFWVRAAPKSWSKYATNVWKGVVEKGVYTGKDKYYINTKDVGQYAEILAWSWRSILQLFFQVKIEVQS